MAYTVTMRDVYHNGIPVATITIVVGATPNDDLIVIENQLSPSDLNNLNLAANSVGLPNTRENLETVLLPNGMSWWSTYRTALVNVGVATQVATDNEISTTPLGLVVIGDSTVDQMFSARWSFPSITATRSNATDLTVGTGYITLYSNRTAVWQAPGDTVGPVTPVANGFTCFESGTANKEFSLCITQPILDMMDNLAEPLVVEAEVSPQDPGFTGKCPSGWAQMLTGWNIPLIANLGSTGDSAAGVRGRINQAFAVDSFGKPTTLRPTVVHVLVGINDVTQIANDPVTYLIQDVKNEYTRIRDIIVGRGCYAVFGTLAKETPTSDEFAIMQELNNHLRYLAQTNARTVVADFFRKVRDGNYDDGRTVTGSMSGLHYESFGGLLAGRELKRVIDDIFHLDHGRSRSQLAGDVTNYLPNGAFLGTAGVLGAGVTGQSAWDVAVDGTLTAVASKEVVEEECPWQVFVCSGGASGGTLIVSSPSNSALTGGECVDADVECDVTSSTDLIGIDHTIKIVYDDESVENLHSFLIEDIVSTPFSHSYFGTMRTSTLQLKPNVDTISTQLLVKVAAGGSVTVKFRCAGIAVC